LEENPFVKTLPILLSRTKMVFIISTLICTTLEAIVSNRQEKKLQHLIFKTSSILNYSLEPHTFSYKDLKMVIENFIKSCLLGVGGCGIVYKGMLHASVDITLVAIKQLRNVDLKKARNHF
jgi:hypothetical protein